MECIKQSLNVKSYPHNYTIYIGNYFKTGLDNLLNKYLQSPTNVIVIYDKKLENLYLLKLLDILKSFKFNYLVIPIEAKETNKSFKKVYEILNIILQHNIKRNSTIIALGGGIIGDISGFVSSITLRGINYINIPTTLLSAVDSSIGGKNGINNKMGKNVIGTFYNPNAVIIDSTVLKTLDQRTILAGFAEIIKCSLINNKDFFNYLYSNLELINSYNENFLNTIIKEALLTKKALVEEDFLDKNNQRALLNLGHTFAHALEKMNNYKSSLSHGEAVAIGICLASRFSSYIGLLDNNKALKICDYIKKLNLPTDYRFLFKQSNTNEQLVKAMSNDKKNTNKDLNLVLLEDIGKASLIQNISATTVLNFLTKEYK